MAAFKRRPRSVCGRRILSRTGSRGFHPLRGAYRPSSLLMMTCWISEVPSVMLASLASR